MITNSSEKINLTLQKAYRGSLLVTALSCSTALHWTWHCITAMHCNALHCTLLHFIALHCTSLHSTFHCASLPLTALQRCRCSVRCQPWMRSQQGANIGTASLNTEAWNTFGTLQIQKLLEHWDVVSQCPVWWVTSHSMWSVSESPFTGSHQNVTHQSQAVLKWSVKGITGSVSLVKGRTEVVSHHLQAVTSVFSLKCTLKKKKLL